MIIDNINLNHLRLFECVYRTHSMTKASEELHLTQSGVSQHIKTLEERLGIKLFDRIRQRLIPTNSAKILYEKTSHELENIEQGLMKLKGIGKELIGNVSIGLPSELGINCAIPILASLCQKHPKLKLHIRYGYADEMNTFILNGDLDFALVDSFNPDKRIFTQPVYTETLFLCALKKALHHKKIKENQKFFETLDYVDYLTGEPVLHMWFKHHFNLKNIDLNVRAIVGGVQGVAKLVFGGVGAGILPNHYIAKLGKEAQRLHFFKGSKKPLHNSVSIAYLKEKTHSPTVTTVSDWLIKNISE